MARTKRLNILNSQKVYNLTIEEPADKVLVTLDNQTEIANEIADYADTQDDLFPERNGVNYKVLYETGIDFNFLKVLVLFAEHVEVASVKPLPLPIIDYLANFPRVVTVLYAFNPELTDKEITSIQQTSAGLKVSIDYRLTASSSPYELMSGLGDITYITDALYITYKGTDYAYAYEFFNSVRDALSGWKVNIIFLTKDNELKEYLLERKAEDEKVKKSLSVWVKVWNLQQLT